MVLRKYGIELHSLAFKDLELVRAWRNDKFVRENMFFQEEISASDQENWFKQLDQSMVYLCIKNQGDCIGLINVKNIDSKKRTGEAGVFIGVQHYRNSHIPMLAIFCLMDVFFEEFAFTKLTAHIRSDNQNALDFNRELGYQINKEDGELTELFIDFPSYLQQKKKLNHLLMKLNKNKVSHTFSEEEKNYLFPRK